MVKGSNVNFSAHGEKVSRFSQKNFAKSAVSDGMGPASFSSPGHPFYAILEKNCPPIPLQRSVTALKRTLRRAAAWVLTLALALSLTVSASAAGWFDPPDTSGAGVLLMDAGTGKVYFARNPDVARPAASMTKLMSLYLVFQAIDDGRLSLDQTIPCSNRASVVSRTAGYSGHENLTEGQEYPLEDLIKLVMTASCNGSMIAMAEYLAGDEAAFVEQMNATAAAWGIDASFADCCGLKDAGNAVSPRAMTEIARRLLTDHPEILNYSTLKSTVFEGRTYTSTNTLLRDGSLPGIDGLKTGYTGGAKYCFTGTALRDGTRMLSVLMGTTSSAKRMSESQALLEYAFTRKDQLARLAQADRDFTVDISSSRDTLVPYSQATLTARVSGYDAPQSVPCEITWLVGGQTVSPQADRVWVEDGAASKITFRPRALDSAEVAVRLRFPDGSVAEARKVMPVSTEDLGLTVKVSAAKSVLRKNESLKAACNVVSTQNYDLSFAAGWYLDGKALAEGQRTDFAISPAGTDVITLQGADLSVGSHTLEFRCNTGRLPRLDQTKASLTFTVRDLSSDWAAETIESAIAADLVPAALQKGYTKAITRQQAAQMFVSLLEKKAEKPIADLLKAKGVTADPNAFTDTKDPAVLACSALGILKGTAPGVFAPNATLTRAQAAAILNRAAGVLGTSTAGYRHSFTDVKGHWADGELGWAAAKGVLAGVGNNLFDPEGLLTNEQTIAIVWRAFGVLGQP